jgi:hypothetical protein
MYDRPWRSVPVTMRRTGGSSDVSDMDGSIFLWHPVGAATKRANAVRFE